jgi:ankyrin repeat protein
MTTQKNLAVLAFEKLLTVEDVRLATKEKLEEDKSKSGYTVLYWACICCHDDVVEAILEKGVDINGLSNKNVTAISGCAFNHKWDRLKMLLSRGANVNLLDTSNMSPLHRTVDSIEFEAPHDIIDALILAGVDPQGRDGDGKTPADIAREKGHETTALYIEQFYAPIKSANMMI